MTTLSPDRRATLFIVLAFAAIYIIWGTTYLAIRVAVDTIPPFLMAGVRFTLAGLLTFAVLRVRGVPLPRLSQWRSAFIIGGFLVVGGNGLVSWAEQQVPSGIAALVVATVPLWMALFDWLLFKGARPGKKVASGLLLGCVGIALLIGPGLFSGVTGISAASWIILFLAPLLWSLGSLYSRQIDLPENTFMATSTEMLAGGVLLLAAGLATGEGARLDLAGISTSSLFATLYLTIFGSIIAFSAYIWLLKQVQATRVATYTYVNPVIAVFLGWAILSEPITPTVLLGAAIVIVAVILITTRKTSASLPEMQAASAGVKPGRLFKAVTLHPKPTDAGCD